MFSYFEDFPLSEDDFLHEPIFLFEIFSDLKSFLPSSERKNCIDVNDGKLFSLMKQFLLFEAENNFIQ